MRILWFANTPCNGADALEQKVTSSSWLQALDLAMQEKVELHIAFYANSQKKEFTHGATTYHVIPPDSLRKSSMKGLLKPHILFEEDLPLYLDIVQKVKPDIVHIHGTETTFGCLAGKVDVPLLLSLQGILNPIAVKYRGDIFDEALLQVKSNKPGVGLKERLFLKSHAYHHELLLELARREKGILNNISNVMGRTAWDRQVMSVLAPHARYFNGDEIMRGPFFEADWVPPSGKQLVVHSTTSDAPMKGFVTICEALVILKEIGLDLKWQIAGLDQHDAIVRIAMQKLGKDFPMDNLVFLGRVTADKLVEAMRVAHLYVLSSHIENSANSLCEAMLLGMPCIATNSGGTPSILSDEKQGLLIQPGDPWVMAGAILRIKQEYHHWLVKAGEARLQARQRHSPEHVVEQVLHAYKEILTKQ